MCFLLTIQFSNQNRETHFILDFILFYFYPSTCVLESVFHFIPRHIEFDLLILFENVHAQYCDDCQMQRKTSQNVVVCDVNSFGLHGMLRYPKQER